MKLLRHPNIVRMHQVMATKTNIYVVLEYVKGPGRAVQQGSAWKAEGRFCSEVYFQQLISAVDFCHSRGVYHRDLKPENLLLVESRIRLWFQCTSGLLQETRWFTLRLLHVVLLHMLSNPLRIVSRLSPFSRKDFDGHV
jgi:serine/threonine protein kinase